jgi:hypothetical protein
MEGRLIGAPMITPELVPLQWSGIKSNPNYGYQNIAPTEQVNDCKLWTAKCRLQTVDCEVPTADCGLQTADCRLPTTRPLVRSIRYLAISLLCYSVFSQGL